MPPRWSPGWKELVRAGSQNCEPLPQASSVTRLPSWLPSLTNGVKDRSRVRRFGAYEILLTEEKGCEQGTLRTRAYLAGKPKGNSRMLLTRRSRKACTVFRSASPGCMVKLCLLNPSSFRRSGRPSQHACCDDIGIPILPSRMCKAHSVEAHTMSVEKNARAPTHTSTSHTRKSGMAYGWKHLRSRTPRSTLSAGKPRTWGRGNFRKEVRAFY